MEIEIKPISFDARIEYLQAVSQNQAANKKSIQWGTAIISIVIGAAGTVGVYYWMQKSKQPKAIKDGE